MATRTLARFWSRPLPAAEAALRPLSLAAPCSTQPTALRMWREIWRACLAQLACPSGRRVTLSTSPTLPMATLWQAWSRWYPLQPPTPLLTCCGGHDWSLSSPSPGRRQLPTRPRDGFWERRSKEEGVEEPPEGALAASADCATARHRTPTGQPAGCPTTEEKGVSYMHKNTVRKSEICKYEIMLR